MSQLKPGDIDWEKIFGDEGVRWFHTGGIFCALSETTPQLARKQWKPRGSHGTIISYDLNYRPSLWKGIGGSEKARAVNRELAPLIDVMLGNEEDFTAALGLEVEGLDEPASLETRRPANFQKMIERAIHRVSQFPGCGYHVASRPYGNG